MIVDPVIKKLNALYVAGNIPTPDYRELTEMLGMLDREFIRCQYRIDERVLEEVI